MQNQGVQFCIGIPTLHTASILNSPIFYLVSPHPHNLSFLQNTKKARAIVLRIQNAKAHLFVDIRIVLMEQEETAVPDLATITQTARTKSVIPTLMNVALTPTLLIGLSVRNHHALLGRVIVTKTQSVKAPLCVGWTTVQAECMVWTVAQAHAAVTLTA